MDDAFVGTLIGELRVVGRLGEGDTGVVYEAWNPAGDRRAVRLFKPELARTPGFFDRLTAVSQKLLTLRLPGIAEHYGIGRVEAGPYALTELVEGEPLSSWLTRRGPPELADILTLGANLCRVLQPLHARGYAHSAVKPENAFLVPGRAALELKLTGFGMPRAARPRTLTHLAPEQLNGEATSPHTDLYALGLTLYRLLTGREAFENQRPRETPPDPRDLRPDTPPQLSALVQSLLSVDPSARPPSAESVGRSLQSLATAPAPVAPPPAPAPTEAPPVFHTTAEILAQRDAPAAPVERKAERNAVDEPPPAPRRAKRWAIAGAVAAVALAAVAWGFWPRSIPLPPVVEKPVAPPPVAVEAPPVAPPPTEGARAVPTGRELVARAKALTQELKRRPSTTYDARTELRKLLRRSEANPDAAERASIAEELDLWQQAYLPQR